MHTAREIADWLLAWAEHNDAPVSNLKMQKLLYYAQGHYLGEKGESLFSDDLQAWAHGPVAPSVYRAFKTSGNEPIDPGEALSDDFDWDDYRDVENHLVRVWNTYGKFEAWSLRERTHREAPWQDAFRDGVRNITIPKDAMKKFFASS